jgi:hypothetical protein
MAARDPGDRRELARLAASARWGRTVDRVQATAPAREAFLKMLEPSPDEVPDPVQRASMARHRLNEHMIKMRRARRRSTPAAPAGQSVTV